MSDHRTLEVWQIADALAKGVHHLKNELPRSERIVLGDQLWRAALGVPLNIVEGYARSSAPQLRYSLNVALGSLAEARYLVGFIVDVGLVPPDAVRPMLTMADALQPRLAAFIRAVEAGRSRHSRFATGA